MRVKCANCEMIWKYNWASGMLSHQIQCPGCRSNAYDYIGSRKTEEENECLQDETPNG